MTNSEQRVLITGCYRTGSEYITQLLGNHPKLETSMYITNFMRFCWNRYDSVDEADNYSALIFDTARRMWLRYGREFDVYDVLETCRESSTVDYGLIYDEIMSDILLSEHAHSWAEKTQLVWTKIPAFLDMFEERKAILIVRDPRSVLASFKEFTYEPEPAYLTAAFNTLDSMQHGLEYRRGLGSDEFHIIRYEDVIREPEPTLHSAFEFLDLSADHDVLSTDGWTKPSGEPWEANSAFADSNEEFDPESAINRWQDTLEPWEVAFSEMINMDVMEKFGYETARNDHDQFDFSERVHGHELLERAYEQWKRSGEGIEAFPSDPLDSHNWTVNQSYTGE